MTRRYRRHPASALLLVRAAMFGAAIGGRGTLVFAGPVLARLLARPTGVAPSTRAASGGGIATIAAVAGLGGELVGDTSPAAPSRLEPLALAGRVAAAVAGAVVLARRERAGVALPVVAAVLGAVTEINVGVRWRGFTLKRGRALGGALAEDAVVVALAAIACWPGSGTGRRRRS
ncbi:hypothetical protein [Glaciibacter sp. 2TAF33]|uniref:hypothetical protein n=1 Tax=Glaciibacter sp. 2TAF33 TaxID=3233015 RepID=UPI003F933759